MKNPILMLSNHALAIRNLEKSLHQLDLLIGVKTSDIIFQLNIAVFCQHFKM